MEVSSAKLHTRDDSGDSAEVSAAQAHKMLCARMVSFFNGVRGIFRTVDSDKDGLLSSDEFKTALGMFGIAVRRGEWKKLFNRYDLDGQGHVDYRELLAAFGQEIAGGAKPEASSMKIGATKDVKKEAYVAFNAARQARVGMMSAQQAHAQIAERMVLSHRLLQSAFRHVDEDHDGRIDPNEFGRVVARLNIRMTDAAFAELWSIYDPNGDGTISFEEFRQALGEAMHGTDLGVSITLTNKGNKRVQIQALAAKQQEGLHTRMTADEVHAIISRKMQLQFRKVRNAFRTMDKDKSGALSTEEFRKVLTFFNLKPKEEVFQELMMRYDKTGDGIIDYNEFITMWGPTVDLEAQAHYVNTYLRQAEDIQREEDAVERQTVVDRRRKMTVEKILDVFGGKMALQGPRVFAAFQHYDAEHCGSVSAAEFRSVLGVMNIDCKDDVFERVLRHYARGGARVPYAAMLRDVVAEGAGTSASDTVSKMVKISTAAADKAQEEHDAPRPVEENPLLNAADVERLLLIKVGEQAKKVRRIFQKLDQRKTGFVDGPSFRIMLDMFHLNPKDDVFAQVMVRLADASGRMFDYVKYLADAANVKGVSVQIGIVDKNSKRVVMMRRAEEQNERLQSHLTATGIHSFLVKTMHLQSSKVRKYFRTLDKDSSGALEHAEFRHFLTFFNLHPSDTEFAKLMAKYDSSGDGAIDYPEFMKLYGPVPSLAEEDAYVQTYLRQKEDIKRDEDKVARADIVARRRQMTAEMMSKVLSAKMTLQFARVRGAFRHHDENQDGTVDQRGFKAVLNSLNLEGSAEEFSRMCNMYDSFGDGKVHYVELLRASAAGDEGPLSGGKAISPRYSARQIRNWFDEAAPAAVAPESKASASDRAPAMPSSPSWADPDAAPAARGGKIAPLGRTRSAASRTRRARARADGTQRIEYRPVFGRDAILNGLAARRGMGSRTGSRQLASRMKHRGRMAGRPTTAGVSEFSVVYGGDTSLRRLAETRRVGSVSGSKSKRGSSAATAESEKAKYLKHRQMLTMSTYRRLP
tara:strand:+ start:152 stop:3250 length:3099 start_codon:yes stop_codon:yes gene_type:complete